MGVTVREIPKGSGIHYVCIHETLMPESKLFRKAKKIGKKKDAEYVAAQVRKEIACGRYPFREPIGHTTIPTLSEYFQDFQNGHMKSLRPKSQESYEGSFKRYIEPKIGNLQLNEITKKTVKSFIDSLKTITYKNNRGQIKTLSKDYVRIIHATLRKILNEAVDDEIISVNPATAMGKRYRELESVHEVNPLNADEAKAFLTAAVTVAPFYFALFVCLLHAGLRIGEAIALLWTDLDLIRRVLHIRKQGVDGGKTKTGKTRQVEVSDFLYDVLADLRLQREKEWGKKIPAHIFCSQTGTPLDAHNFRFQQFKKVLTHAGLRNIRLHDLRHTYATLHLQSGSPLQWVSKQLGHASIKMTCDVYYHYLPDTNNRESVNRLPSINQPGNNNLLILGVK